MTTLSTQAGHQPISAPDAYFLAIVATALARTILPEIRHSSNLMIHGFYVDICEVVASFHLSLRFPYAHVRSSRSSPYNVL